MFHGSWLMLVWLPGTCSWPGPDGTLGLIAHGYLGLSGLDVAHGHLINFQIVNLSSTINLKELSNIKS